MNGCDALKIYVCENSPINMSETQKRLMQALENANLSAQVRSLTYIPEIFFHRLSSELDSVCIVALNSEVEGTGIEIGKMIRKINPRAYIIMIVDEDINYLKILESNIEVLDLLKRDDPNFIQEIENCLKYIDSRCTHEDAI